MFALTLLKPLFVSSPEHLQHWWGHLGLPTSCTQDQAVQHSSPALRHCGLPHWQDTHARRQLSGSVFLHAQAMPEKEKTKAQIRSNLNTLVGMACPPCL